MVTSMFSIKKSVPIIWRTNKNWYIIFQWIWMMLKLITCYIHNDAIKLKPSMTPTIIPFITIVRAIHVNHMLIVLSVGL